MKIKTILLGLYFIIMHANASANPSLNCPPTQMIKTNSVFTRTQGTALPTLKQIFTDNYLFENKTWQTLFIFYIPDKDIDNTLAYGQDLFNHATLADTPESTQDQTRFSCTYKTDKGILVQAYTQTSRR